MLRRARAAIVALVQAAKDEARLLQRLEPGEPVRIAERIGRAEREKVVEIALRDLQAAVHVEFAERQLGIEHQRPIGGRVGEADGDRRPGAVAERALRAVGGLDFQVAVANEIVEKNRENQRAHFTPLDDARLARRKTRGRVIER